MAAVRCSVLALFLVTACAADPNDDANNPFLQDMSALGKADTAYLNPDGVEVEVDLQGIVEAPSTRLDDGPAELGQFALTYLRKRGQVFLESLAEDAASTDRAEWLVNGRWLKSSQVPSGAVRRQWRLRAINAVMLFPAGRNARVGQVLTAKVPVRPFSMMATSGQSCADRDSHIGLDQSVYWYLWNPDLSACKATTQDLQITVSKTMVPRPNVYPEYNRLVADRKLTVVILFGQIGDGLVSDTDAGMLSLRQMATWLRRASFREVAASVGRRFTKTLRSGVQVVMDLYSPREFAGLDDDAHFANFQKALSEHEIVVYDGHSMLGASDFWSRPTYPSSYQIFLYGGCLGYEYYVRPIVAGKNGWQNLDILSSVVEVSATANDFGAPALAKIFWALDNGYRASWSDILVEVRRRVGDSTFGVSGVRDNCFTPTGASACPNP
jgi:hypothetical protein